MNIPAEFYEEEFIEFEDFMDKNGYAPISTSESPHAKSTYYLEKYKDYEKALKKENKKILKKKEKKKPNKGKVGDKQGKKCSSGVPTIKSSKVKVTIESDIRNY